MAKQEMEPAKIARLLAEKRHFGKPSWTVVQTVGREPTYTALKSDNGLDVIRLSHAEAVKVAKAHLRTEYQRAKAAFEAYCD